MLVAVAMVLLGVELALRVVGGRVSTDEQHLRRIPALARGLHDRPGTRLLLLGNSLTGCAVEEQVLLDELAERGLQGLASAKIAADASGLDEWYFYLRRHFVQPGLCPEIVVLGFAGQELADRRADRAQARRLAHNVCTLADVPELCTGVLSDLELRAQFLGAYFAYSLARQEAVRHRVLRALVPHYEAETQRLNRAARAPRRDAGEGPGAGGVAAERVTYVQLARLIEMLRGAGTHCVFVTMPDNTRYDLPPGPVEVIRSGGMTLVDCRDVNLAPHHYLDGMHLNGEGSRVFSRALARALAPTIGSRTALSRGAAPGDTPADPSQRR